MGGLVAPRAAAFDHRIAALLAVDGVYDMGPIATSALPGNRVEAERRLRADHDPDATLEAAMAAGPMLRWAMRHGMYAMGADTPRAFSAACLDYHLRDGIAEKITCPTLVRAGVDDGFFKASPNCSTST
jgi:pimeloyl-ACP methyl ester carboxylesterase